ncbi:MAG: xanthine dehydrogenase family protein subunit M [Desulfobacterales bacterium]|nr:xanthine dehydrogenase family protein subunit M [Desulfobacterales bacterium]
MRSFTHLNARTIDEACRLLKRYSGKAVLNAGGTDLLSTLKGENLFYYPEAVINIKAIPGLDFIREEGGFLKIGALGLLSDIAGSPLLNEKYRCLAEAAHSVASPQVRNMATIGGNLCQDVRCWYYRYPRHIGGPIDCARKGNGPCHAVTGDNRYHAIMGGKKCFVVCPSDTAVAFTAFGGEVTITGPEGQRAMAMTEFYNPLKNGLKRGEMVTEIRVPQLTGTTRQTYSKFTLRKPIDFAIVSVAAVITSDHGICTDARIALGAVGPRPVRATAAEELLRGRAIDEEVARRAAELSVAEARPLSKNAYKAQITKTLVKRSILSLR